MKRAATYRLEEDDACEVLQGYLDGWEVEGRRILYGEFLLPGGIRDFAVPNAIPPLLELNVDMVRLVEGIMYVKVSDTAFLYLSNVTFWCSG